MSKEKDSSKNDIKNKNELITLDFLNKQKEQLEKEMLKAYTEEHSTYENMSENQSQNKMHRFTICMGCVTENSKCLTRLFDSEQPVIESSNDKPYDLELMTGNTSNDKEKKDGK